MKTAWFSHEVSMQDDFSEGSAKISNNFKLDYANFFSSQGEYSVFDIHFLSLDQLYDILCFLRRAPES